MSQLWPMTIDGVEYQVTGKFAARQLLYQRGLDPSKWRQYLTTRYPRTPLWFWA